MTAIGGVIKKVKVISAATINSTVLHHLFWLWAANSHWGGVGFKSRRDQDEKKEDGKKEVSRKEELRFMGRIGDIFISIGNAALFFGLQHDTGLGCHITEDVIMTSVGR